MRSVNVGGAQSLSERILSRKRLEFGELSPVVRIGLPRLICGVSLDRCERMPEVDLQIELPLLPRGAVGQAGQ